MSDMQVAPVDERDSGWELPTPRFRVYLHGSGDSSTYGWTDTCDITGADVVQVMDWAQRQAGDLLTYAIALVYDDPVDGRGLVWLVGMDGNDQPVDDREADIQRRMLARRQKPIILPPADRMPPDVPDRYARGIRRP